MISLLLLTTALLGLLAFFEPCTIATHTLYSVRTHQQNKQQIFRQIIILWLSRSILIISLFSVSVWLFEPPQWSDWLPGLILIMIASVYLISRIVYIPVPHLEFYKLLPVLYKTKKELSQSIQLGFTLPACTLPLIMIVIGMVVNRGTIEFAVVSGLLFSSLFTLPLLVAILLGIDDKGAKFLRRSALSAPYITALLFILFALYLFSTIIDFGVDVAMLKEQLSDISFLGLGLAFTAGFVFSFNPVSFASIPVMLAYVTRSHEKHQALLLGGAFVLGLISTHVILGVSAALGGEWVKTIMGREWALLLGPILITMGLVWANWLKIHLPWVGAKGRKISSFWGAFLLAIPFSIAICPFCAPALLVALTASASIGSLWFGAALLFAFALGRSIPIILGAWSMDALESLTFFHQWQRLFEKIAGITLILVGIFMFNEYFIFFTY